LVIGSIFPVATTDRTIVPRSAVATLEGSTSVEAPLRVARPAAAAPTSITAPMAAYHRFRDLFLIPAFISAFYVSSRPEVHDPPKG
jgi:hypothetical protein